MKFDFSALENAGFCRVFSHPNSKNLVIAECNNRTDVWIWSRNKCDINGTLNAEQLKALSDFVAKMPEKFVPD